jgi:ABC-type nitrate/sulfonate/bicarbonate transport system permease component
VYTSPEQPEPRSSTGPGDGGARAPRAISPAITSMPRAAAWRSLLIGLAALLIPLAIWYTVVVVRERWGFTLLPTPYETYEEGRQLARGRPLEEFTIYQHIADSLRRWALGFGLAMLAGVITGLLLGWSRLLERLFMPTVHVLQLIPGLAWIAVALPLFGVTERSTIFMIAMTALAPIVINTTAGVKGVDEMYLRAARMMGTDNRTLFLRVLLPGSLPHLLSGLRVGLANGWRVLVAAEMIVGTGTGLGYSIIQARWNLNYAPAFVCLFIICAIGLIVERGIFAPLERRTVERWGLARTG